MIRQHSAVPSFTGLIFTSREVCEIAEVTPRQLQWWDEHQVVRPPRADHKRTYRAEDVLAVLVAAEVRRKGLSLQKIRRVLRVLYRESLGELLSAESEWFIVADGHSAHLENGRDEALALLLGARRPMWLVSVTQQAARLREGAKKVRSKRDDAVRRKKRAAETQLRLFRE